LSRSIISVGVPRGTPTPDHVLTSKPAMDSLMVGTSGNHRRSRQRKDGERACTAVPDMRERIRQGIDRRLNSAGEKVGDEGRPAPIWHVENIDPGNAGLTDAALRARLAEVGAVPLQLTPDEFGARITRDVEKWAKVIKLAGIGPY